MAVGASVGSTVASALAATVAVVEGTVGSALAVTTLLEGAGDGVDGTAPWHAADNATRTPTLTSRAAAFMTFAQYGPVTVKSDRQPATSTPQRNEVDGWLAELGLSPIERDEREGATSWDLLLDGRKRRALRVTLILDPAVALIAWVHLAPPIADNFRKTYRQLLRWNDEFPFAKFAVSDDERPMLTAEIAAAGLDRDTVGALLARVLAIADLIHDQSMLLMGELRRRHAKLSAAGGPDPAGVALLERYAADIQELA